MNRTVAEKMGVREGTRSYFANAPATAIAAMDLPKLNIRDTLLGEFGYLHLFVVTQAQMDNEFPMLKRHLEDRGMLWLSWPKARQLGTDLTLPVVIRIGYSHGLVESTTLRIDDMWSAMKFTHPKPGNKYQNSYGTLPRH